MAFISRFDNRKPKQPDDLVNERVRFKEVLVIDQNGDQLGVKSSREALDIAYDANLDLVCVAPNAKPPVCRIMDFGKYRFEQQKKAREMKKNSKVVTLKETQLSVTIDTHDKNVKLKRTLKWLEEGNKVKVAIRFRGRQLAHVDLGKKVIDDFVEECAEVGQIEKPAKLEGRTLTAILAPKKKKSLMEESIMPKIDTHSGLKKRLKRTGSGKLKRSHAYISHLSHNKTHKQKKHLAKATVVSASDYKRIKSRLPK